MNRIFLICACVLSCVSSAALVVASGEAPRGTPPAAAALAGVALLCALLASTLSVRLVELSSASSTAHDPNRVSSEYRRAFAILNHRGATLYSHPPPASPPATSLTL